MDARDACAARDHVSALAQYDTDGALRCARNINDLWYKCQSLASVALHCNNPELRDGILSESFDTAFQLNDPYRTVAVSAWPLKLLCQIGDHERLQIEVERLLSIIAREPSPVIRADAINMMLGAVVMGPKCQFWQVYDAFRQAAFTRLKTVSAM